MENCPFPMVLPGIHTRFLAVKMTVRSGRWIFQSGDKINYSHASVSVHFCSFVHQVILREAWSQNVFFAWNLCNMQHLTNWRHSRNFSDFWTRGNDSYNIIPLLTEASLPNITNISLSKSIFSNRNRTIVRKRSFLMILVFWSIWKCTWPWQCILACLSPYVFSHLTWYCMRNKNYTRSDGKKQKAWGWQKLQLQDPQPVGEERGGNLPIIYQLDPSTIMWWWCHDLTWDHF